MEYRTTPSNLFVAVLLVCLCFLPAAAADDGTAVSGEMPRSFADVPSWITDSLGVKPPAEGGYVVDEPLPDHPGGVSDIRRAAAARDASEVPAWIVLAAGISGIAVLALAAFQFLPILIGRTREAPPSSVRDGIFAAISETPGCSAAVLREKTGIHYATLRYHLAVLEKEKRIVSRSAGHIYHYFPNGSSLSRADTIRMTLCQNPTTEKVLGLIEKEPGISGTVLAARAGISSGTLTWHLGRLQKNDLITISRVGRGMRIFPQDHT
ncbi:MAG: winged helix-turn-helix transcriptional regulator [Methanocorpusculum sp.]|nr:winged helix-turn-helix transcriptional regulator [Methanocorpusculum sp.]